jgi:hypothetical protein
MRRAFLASSGESMDSQLDMFIAASLSSYTVDKIVEELEDIVRSKQNLAHEKLAAILDTTCAQDLYERGTCRPCVYQCQVLYTSLSNVIPWLQAFRESYLSKHLRLQLALPHPRMIRRKQLMIMIQHTIQFHLPFRTQLMKPRYRVRPQIASLNRVVHLYN